MKKQKLNILRLVFFSCILCAVTVAVFAVSGPLFERLARAVGASADTTKNAHWLIAQAQNLTLLPVLAILCGLFSRRGQSADVLAVYHREKKLSLIILLVFLYFVFLPYYVSQNTAGNVNVFEAVADKAVWFAFQFIFILSLIMYQADRENKLLEETSKTAEVENEEQI